jgi:hypothetical protein
VVEMANICHNRIEFTGKACDLAGFMMRFFGEIFYEARHYSSIAFAYITPPPDDVFTEEKLFREKYGFKENYFGNEDDGTAESSPLKKWREEKLVAVTEPFDVAAYVEDCPEGQKLVVGFDTKWVPPEGWFFLIAENFPNLDFTCYYYEYLRGFVGKQVFSRGLRQSEEYFLSDNPEWKKKMEEYFGYEEHDVPEIAQDSLAGITSVKR